jgi:hypothetical protein
MRPSDTDEQRLLASWKEIADHLGVTARTAQKWETERGLPVHRQPGEKGRVWASAAELDRWRITLSNGQSWWNSLRFFRYYSLGASLAAILALAAAVTQYVARHQRGAPATFRAEFATLTVMDAGGREVFRRTFDKPFATAAYDGYEGQRRIWFGDIDGDRRTETLFVYLPSEANLLGTTLYCFSDGGAPKWIFTPGRTISDAGGASYPPPYVISGISVMDLGAAGGRRIAVTSRHPVHYPNQFVLLDGRGAVQGEYWHSGHLDYVQLADLDGDGVQEILLAGVNNAYKQATLVVLDSRDFTGASWQGEGSPYQILGYPPGKELAALLFPRTCINRKFEMYNMARTMSWQGGLIRVTVFERTSEEDVVIIYTLDANLKLLRAEMSDFFRATHRRLEGDGVLDHPLASHREEELRDVRMVGGRLGKVRGGK